ncbi:DNA ligase D [Aureimonas populi]|uniref:DNA ligase (ATP) n=1 Tax=Aureimonas populi TaxID=1701758 RepID=A0ABW5CIC6_9HYPH|nr:DNA ligase D [Aureimonas populi]
MAGAAEALLKAYREKRDFSRTQEPAGGAPSAQGLVFVVQKHDATRLHYDFRFEWEGVLKSWAVTRGPSLDTAEKRLAVRTEDHPMDYGDFEGTIPAGQYGGGTVMLWDFGLWEPREDPDEGFRKGSLKLDLHGEKMVGHWALVRMKPRGKETRENWLLIKEKDEFADPDRDLLALDRSVKTGRSLEEIASGGETWKRPTKRPNRPASSQTSARRRPKAAGTPPPFRPLQLATLVSEVPQGNEWLHEMKYDGYRVLAAVGGGTARLFTRNELDWTDRFAPLAPSFSALPCKSALIDGEIVAYDENGAPDFSSLQKALKEGGALACFAFDLLELDGEDLTARPLTERKRRLEALMRAAADPALLYSEHVRGSGGAVLGTVCKAGHEGIVSKLADAPYRAGRGTAWVKSKCGRRQEFVIGGYSPSDKKGRAFASILIGAFEDGRLVYRGRVGSGFDERSLAELAERFKPLARKDKPFESLPREIARGARFVEPKLIAEVDFAELTSEGAVRHGVFKGLREDKEAETVADEKPAEPPSPQKAEEAARPRAGKGAGEPVSVCGVRLTSPGREVFHAHGVTKLDLAHYYEAVAGRMLAHAGQRPLSLVRCPQTGAKRCFFQKHDTGGFPDAIGHVEVTEKDGEAAAYLTLSGPAGLIAAVQMNTLEFHIWGSRNDRLENPDRLVFDLDPDESLGFSDVRRAAMDLRARLDKAGLATFPLVTGGKGVHLVAPLSRRQGWEEVKDFARTVAARLAQDEPERFVATMSKAKRKGRIFIDWLRNERGQTAVAPYSTRSREGAPIAAPVSWAELETLEAANLFRIPQVLERLEKPDPWEGYGKLRQSITARARQSFA